MLHSAMSATVPRRAVQQARWAVSEALATSRHLRLGASLVVAVSYYASARLGIHLGTIGGIAAPIWPPPGLCLAAVFLVGYRVWPGIALGALATGLFVGRSLPFAVAMTVVNTLAAVGGAWLLYRAKYDPAVRRARDVVAILVVACLTAAVHASVVSLVRYASADGGLSELWRASWTSDAMSVLLLTPLICTWAMPRHWRPAVGAVEATLIFSVQGVMTFCLFFATPHLPPLKHPYLLYPGLLWSAVRLGQRGATASLFLVAAIAVGATVSGVGPFIGPNNAESLLSLHTFLAVATVSFMMLGASVEERRAALMRVSEGLEAVVRSCSDAVVGTSPDGTITSWNGGAEHLLGYAAHEAMGCPITTIFPAAMHDPICESYGQVGRGRRIRDIDAAMVTRQGVEVPVSLALSPLVDDEGTTFGVSLVARDIRDRNRAGQERERLVSELEEAVHLRDDFLSVASHELRTPVTALSLKLSRLGDAATEAERLRQLEAATRVTRRLGTLVNDLLDVTRVRVGQLVLAYEEVDLCSVVRETVGRSEEQATRVGSVIALELPGAVVGSWDPRRLEQIVDNLVSNAIKYGAGRPIQVAVEADGAAARLSVTDGGIGISAEEQARIFERFRRATSSKSYSGLGLGLWITREIVNAFGGEIRVDSEPGRGSRFLVELPLRRQEPGGA